MKRFFLLLQCASNLQEQQALLQEKFSLPDILEIGLLLDLDFRKFFLDLRQRDFYKRGDSLDIRGMSPILNRFSRIRGTYLEKR